MWCPESAWEPKVSAVSSGRGHTSSGFPEDAIWTRTTYSFSRTRYSCRQSSAGPPRNLAYPQANLGLQRAIGCLALHNKKGGRAPIRVPCSYQDAYYVEDYKTRIHNRGAFREMDFVKQRLGIEVQFGEYAFMVYNVCAKMTIFHNLGHINHGVEIVPVKAFADGMSTGVSYFEQFIWDLEHRGVSNIDIPVMILGIDA